MQIIGQRLAVFSWKSWSWQLAKQKSRNKMPGEREVRDLSFDEPLGASQRTGSSGRNFPTKFRIDLRFVKIYDVVQARAGFSERDLIRHHAAWMKGYLISMKAHGSTLMSWSLSSSFLYVSFWWVLRFWRSCAICLWNQAIWISTCFQCVSWIWFCRACRRTWYFFMLKSWRDLGAQAAAQGPLCLTFSDRLVLLSKPWILCLWRGQEHKETQGYHFNTVQLVEHGYAQMANDEWDLISLGLMTKWTF